MLGLLTAVVCDYPHLFRRGNAYMGHAVLFEKITDMLIERNAENQAARGSAVGGYTTDRFADRDRRTADPSIEQPAARRATTGSLSLSAAYSDSDLMAMGTIRVLSGKQWTAIEEELTPLAALAYDAFRRGLKYLDVRSKHADCVALATRTGILRRDRVVQYVIPQLSVLCLFRQTVVRESPALRLFQHFLGSRLS
jgi:hypothetical protein